MSTRELKASWVCFLDFLTNYTLETWYSDGFVGWSWVGNNLQSLALQSRCWRTMHHPSTKRKRKTKMNRTTWPLYEHFMKTFDWGRNPVVDITGKVLCCKSGERAIWSQEIESWLPFGENRDLILAFGTRTVEWSSPNTPYVYGLFMPYPVATSASESLHTDLYQYSCARPHFS